MKQQWPLTRPKKNGSWQRDPEGMRLRIMRAATAEFARYGFGGARLERIAQSAGANKRMIYYHVGDKEALYLAVLEGAHDHIRAAERKLNLEGTELIPVDGIVKQTSDKIVAAANAIL